MTIVHHDHRNNDLTVVGVIMRVGGVGLYDLWPMVVGHVFGFHREHKVRGGFLMRSVRVMSRCVLNSGLKHRSAPRQDQ
jgi:hypothetical protein